MTATRTHDDGTRCGCAAECTCHPPTRNEPSDVMHTRGSFHLETCPAFKRCDLCDEPRAERDCMICGHACGAHDELTHQVNAEYTGT